MNEVFSYHTFILPFIWDVPNSKIGIQEKICSLFDSNPNWKCTDFDDEYSINLSIENMTEDDAYLLYAEYQYFNPAARRAMYGLGAGIVRNYCFRPDCVKNKGQYIIEAKGNKYVLMINAIRLRIYNTGVALFVLECENIRSAEYHYQNNLDAVKNINDYGRRISLPFLPREDSGFYTICADKLTLSIDGIGVFVSDYMELARKTKTAEDVMHNVSFTHMCDFVKEIMSFGGDCKFTSNPKHVNNKENVFYIYPAIDDRMFVACVINDKTCAEHYTRQDDGKYEYLCEKSNMSKDLYELAFVDPAGGCSCMHSEMRRELLEKHVYRRWIDYGTITTVANQSLISVSNFAPTVNSFITQYYQLCCLCLVQRASILNFQREAAAVSQTIEKRGKSINAATTAKILDLQERFVAFQNQLSFSEVTPQEQGVDLYNMIMESFYIENEKVALKEQLESLYSAANTNLDFTLNKGGTIFALVAIVLSLASFATDLIAVLAFFFSPDNVNGLSKFILFTAMGGIVAIIGFVIGIIVLKYRRKR